MSLAHPYFHWYDRVTWSFVDHTIVSLLIMVIASTFFSNFVAYHHFCVRCTNCIYLLASCQSQSDVDMLYSKLS